MEKFFLIKSFGLVVPQYYKSTSQLGTFRKKYGNRFHLFNDEVTDDNFNKVSTKLIPGQKFKVKIFQWLVVGEVLSKNCLALYRRQKAAFVGAQGLSLVYEECEKELPINEGLISFDKEKALFKDGRDDYWLPTLGISLVGGKAGPALFSLTRFKDWHNNKNFILFVEE